MFRIASLTALLAILAGCPSPRSGTDQTAVPSQAQQPISPAEDTVQPAQPPAAGDSGAQAGSDDAKTKMVKIMESSLENLEGKLARLRDSGPAPEVIAEAEKLNRAAREALNRLKTTSETGDELMLVAHTLNTALFKLDQFLSSHGH